MSRAESPFTDAEVVCAVKDLCGGDLGEIVAYLCADTTHKAGDRTVNVKNQLRRLGRAGKPATATATDEHDAHGRHAWPPRRGDGTGWAEWAGPQPGIRRGPDGISRRMDRARLKALGNAVVPQCAEAIGRVIAEIVRAGAES